MHGTRPFLGFSPQAVLQFIQGFEVGTAASIRTESREQQPTMTFAVDAESYAPHENALDWLSLSREALPDARPMTADERSSINEFFLSHF